MGVEKGEGWRREKDGGLDFSITRRFRDKNRAGRTRLKSGRPGQNQEKF